MPFEYLGEILITLYCKYARIPKRQRVVFLFHIFLLAH